MLVYKLLAVTRFVKIVPPVFVKLPLMLREPTLLIDTLLCCENNVPELRLAELMVDKVARPVKVRVLDVICTAVKNAALMLLSTTRELPVMLIIDTFEKTE